MTGLVGSIPSISAESKEELCRAVGRRGYGERKMERKRDGSSHLGDGQEWRERERDVRRRSERWKVSERSGSPFLLPPLMHPIPFPISTFPISNGSFEMVAGPRGKKLNTVTIMFNHYFCR